MDAVASMLSAAAGLAGRGTGDSNSRHERRLMRQRGAGFRKLENAQFDFGFALSTGENSFSSAQDSKSVGDSMPEQADELVLKPAHAAEDKQDNDEGNMRKYKMQTDTDPHQAREGSREDDEQPSKSVEVSEDTSAMREPTEHSVGRRKTSRQARSHESETTDSLTVKKQPVVNTKKRGRPAGQPPIPKKRFKTDNGSATPEARIDHTPDRDTALDADQELEHVSKPTAVRKKTGRKVKQSKPKNMEDDPETELMREAESSCKEDALAKQTHRSDSTGAANDNESEGASASHRQSSVAPGRGKKHGRAATAAKPTPFQIHEERGVSEQATTMQHVALTISNALQETVANITKPKRRGRPKKEAQSLNISVVGQSEKDLAKRDSGVDTSGPGHFGTGAVDISDPVVIKTERTSPSPHLVQKPQQKRRGRPRKNPSMADDPSSMQLLLEQQDAGHDQSRVINSSALDSSNITDTSVSEPSQMQMLQSPTPLTSPELQRKMPKRRQRDRNNSINKDMPSQVQVVTTDLAGNNDVRPVSTPTKERTIFEVEPGMIDTSPGPKTPAALRSPVHTKPSGTQQKPTSIRRAVPALGRPASDKKQLRAISELIPSVRQTVLRPQAAEKLLFFPPRDRRRKQKEKPDLEHSDASRQPAAAKRLYYKNKESALQQQQQQQDKRADWLKADWFQPSVPKSLLLTPSRPSSSSRP